MDWREEQLHISPHDRNPDDWVNGGRVTVDPPAFAWPDLVNGPYWVQVRWLKLEGRWACVGLSIDFAPGARVRPLQTKDLRRAFKMGDLLEEAAVLLRSVLGDEVDAWAPDAEAAMREIDKAITRRGGRQPVSVDILRRVAEVYSAACDKGEPPTKAVQEHFGIEKGRAARWVWLCRNDTHRLLPPTEQGRARGNRKGEKP